MISHTQTVSRLVAVLTALGFLSLAACGEKPSDPVDQKDEQTAAAAVNSDATKPQEEAEDGHSHAAGEKDAH